MRVPINNIWNVILPSETQTETVTQLKKLDPPKSAYIIWLQAEGREIVKTQTHTASFAALGKLAGEVWQNLDNVIRTTYGRNIRRLNISGWKSVVSGMRQESIVLTVCYQ